MNPKKTSLPIFFHILIKNRRRIIINFIFVGIFSALISLILPEWYRAYSTILPPTDEQDLTNISSFVGDLRMQALGLGQTSEQTDIYIATLKSRTVMESVANKFNLMKIYRAKNIEKTIKILRKHCGVNLDEEGTITVFAEAKTSWFAMFNKNKKNKARLLAKDMTNFFISELDRISAKLRTSKARNTRIFIEERFNQNIEDLHHAEDLFKQFQEKHGTIALPEQTNATISAMAELKAQIITKEVELGVLRKNVGEKHADFIKTYDELKELNKKYDEMNVGKLKESSNREVKTDQKDVFLTLENVPNLSLHYARLYRDVLIQEKIMEFLLPQFEQAKIQEARDTPTVQVLDEAVKPIKKHRPKRMILVLFYGFLSFIFTMLYFYFEPTFFDFYKELSNLKS